jgi:tRNA U34 2-thiouridine synthase MnmA/TrmU
LIFEFRAKEVSVQNKAIVLLSGGMDSILATKLMLEQGVEVHAMNFHIDFACCTKGGAGAAKNAAAMLGVELETVDITKEYLEIFKKPKHGYGANINPCIDCKIFMLKKAKERMAEVGASFLVTGEVLGERPMSQRRDALNIIERDAGVRGILLRPLTAKTLPPTIPEKEGVVNREKLLDIRGRSRKPQIALAEKYGITEYPQPAGGCLLTDPGFAKRVKDLFAHGEVTVENLKLLKVGRYFRLPDGSKFAVGRDKDENALLQAVAVDGDIFFKMRDCQGPIGLLRGEENDDTIKLAASIAAYHTKKRAEPALAVNYWKKGEVSRATVSVKPADITEIERFRL